MTPDSAHQYERPQGASVFPDSDAGSLRFAHERASVSDACQVGRRPRRTTPETFDGLPRLLSTPRS